MRIAYVEDNPTNLALVERVASMNRHVIVSYTEGEIALQELKREIFDLILMDVELAGDMGGLEVVRKLRAHGLQTPIIAVTAYAMIGDRDKCIEAGCTDYLSKPMPIPQLIALFNRFDEITKRAASAPAPAPITSEAPAVPPAPTSLPVPSVSAAPIPVPTIPSTPSASPVPPATPQTEQFAVPVEVPVAKPEATASTPQPNEIKP